MIADLTLRTNWSFADLLIAIVVVAAVVGVVVVALRVFGVVIPSWVVQIFWIVACAFIAIVAIRLIVSF